MKITKLKIAFSLLAFPLISFLLFFNWAQTVVSDPNNVSGGFAIVQYGVIYGSVLACNSPTLWMIAFSMAGIAVIYGMFRRNPGTYLLLNGSLFVIFLIPMLLAVTGTSRFCMSFLGFGA